MKGSSVFHSAVISAATLAMLFLQSCLPDYFPRRYLKETVTDDQVLGRWRLTQQSAQMLDQHSVTVNSRDSTVEFFQNGQCLLHDFVYDEDPITAPGTWKIEYDVGKGQRSYKKSELRITVVSPDGSHTYFVDFYRRYKKLLLWRYYGDPDSRQYIEYERQ